MVRIRILKCDADWDRMAAAEGGRHCARCDRVVRDLTAASQVEIGEALLREPDLCGYFQPSQLARFGLAIAWLVLPFVPTDVPSAVVDVIIGEERVYAPLVPLEAPLTELTSAHAEEVARGELYFDPLARPFEYSGLRGVAGAPLPEE